MAWQTKASMIQRLASFRKQLQPAFRIKEAFSQLHDQPRRLLGYCYLADTLGCTLADVFDTWAAASETDLGILIDELRNSSDNLALAYAGEDLDQL